MSVSEVAANPENAAIEQWPEPPRLLVQWSSPWEEFKTAFRPALARPPKALAGEAPIGIFPYRGMLACWALECLLLIAIIVLPGKFVSLQIPAPPAETIMRGNLVSQCTHRRQRQSHSSAAIKSP